MIPAKAKAAYWGVVRDCLVEFHDMPAAAARRKCEQRRRDVEARPNRLARDLYYHREAFDVACDIAEKELDITQFRAEYDRILDANHPPQTRARR